MDSTGIGIDGAAVSRGHKWRLKRDEGDGTHSPTAQPRWRPHSGLQAPSALRPGEGRLVHDELDARLSPLLRWDLRSVKTDSRSRPSGR